MVAPDGGEPLRVICGPTGAGKTSLVMEIAERLRMSVISADSRQIYRRFDVGTAKPTHDERGRVPHHGVDIVEPVARYSAAAFAADAAAWIAADRAEGRAPAVVGGTGFYIRSLVHPLFEEPPLDSARRIALAAFLATLDTPALRRWCAVLDPGRAHLGRVQLLRAVEIASLTGRRLSELHGSAPRARVVTARYLLVDAGPALAARIEHRVDAMFRAGWLDEVRALAREVPADAPAWRATGYAAVRTAASGEWTEQRAREAVVIATRQYAKRQRTWFRHQLAADDVTTVDTTAPDAVRRALAWWNAQGDETR